MILNQNNLNSTCLSDNQVGILLLVASYYIISFINSISYSLISYSYKSKSN